MTAPDASQKFRSWTCKNKSHRKQRNPPQEKEDGDSYCYFCTESHSHTSHTRSRADSRKRDLTHADSNNVQALQDGGA
jgi:hypothetical protein